MCIICVSKVGVRQPTVEELKTMWDANPHGAGYMYLDSKHQSGNKVFIRKGFMTFDDFIKSVNSNKFTASDPVVYHFRISTQAGVCPEMTHPFPLTKELKYMKALDIWCKTGVAHNGIIHMTSNGDKEYNDTALFIAKYMTKLVKDSDDLKDEAILKILSELTSSRLAILDNSGYIATVGYWTTNRDGVMFSNGSYLPPMKYQSKARTIISNSKFKNNLGWQDYPEYDYD